LNVATTMTPPSGTRASLPGARTCARADRVGVRRLAALAPFLERLELVRVRLHSGGDLADAALPDLSRLVARLSSLAELRLPARMGAPRVSLRQLARDANLVVSVASTATADSDSELRIARARRLCG
jgi:hypothetical protein